MKRLVYLVVLAFLIGSCATTRLDLSRLTTGMTKAEVREIVGRPDRVLAVNDTENGYQEILEYRTSRDEVYALEFWNDFLTGYEFLYDDVNYVPVVVPPMWYPERGRPLFPPGYFYIKPNRPNQNSRPSQSSRPGNSSQSTRPEQPRRPSTDNSNVTRPTPEVRPSTSRSTNSSSGSTSTERSGSRR